MDSTMYFFEGSEACSNVIPVLEVMSSSCGTSREVHFTDLPLRGGGGTGWPAWEYARVAFMPKRMARVENLTSGSVRKSSTKKNHAEKRLVGPPGFELGTNGLWVLPKS